MVTVKRNILYMQCLRWNANEVKLRESIEFKKMA